jgi:hypothetical protein
MSSQQIELDLDMDNELVFKVSIEGTSPAPAKTRFLVEAQNFSLVFPAKNIENGEVSISIPKLENIIKEGSYSGTLEVIVDDRVFTPIEINTSFSKSVKVVAEAVTRRRSAKVTAGPVVSVNPGRKSRKRSKPAVSTRVNNESKAKISRSLMIERHIRALANKRNVSLSESQVKTLVKNYSILNKK